MDKKKYYPVRSSNNLNDLRKWMKWAKKNYPMQKFLIINESIKKLKGKDREYWKMRFKEGLDHKYYVYGSY